MSKIFQNEPIKIHSKIDYNILISSLEGMVSNYDMWKKREGLVKNTIIKMIERKRQEHLDYLKIRRFFEKNRDEVFASSIELKKPEETKKRRKREKTILCEDDIIDDLCAIFNSSSDLKGGPQLEKSGKNKEVVKRERKNSKKEIKKKQENNELKDQSENTDNEESNYLQNSSKSRDKDKQTGLNRKNSDTKDKLLKNNDDKTVKTSRSVNTVIVNQGTLKINEEEFKKGEKVKVVLFDEDYTGEICGMNFSEVILKTKVDKMKIQTSSLRTGKATIQRI